MEALLDEAQQRRLTAAWTQLGRPDLYDVPSQTEEEDVRASESRDCSRDVHLRGFAVRRNRLNENTSKLKRELDARGLSPQDVGFPAPRALP